MPPSITPQADPDLHCPECGYNLRGIDSPRCPECGTTIDRAALAQGRIPWVQRRAIGSVRAYLRTLRLVMLHPAELAAQAQWPVSYDTAWRFRVVTVILAAVPIMALVALVHWNVSWEELLNEFEGVVLSAIEIDFLMPLAVGLSFMLVPLLGVVLWLAAATGVAAWFARQKTLAFESQNRIVVLLQYACAPLVWLVAPMLVYAAAVINTMAEERLLGPTPWLSWLGHLVALVVIGWWWWTIVRVLHDAAGSANRSTVFRGVALLVVWLVLLAIVFVALPWVIGNGWLIVMSLT